MKDKPPAFPETDHPPTGSDRRGDRRFRTRLHSAKLLRLDGAFICDCRMHDVSKGGARIVLARDVALPELFLFFDDDTRRTSVATPVWRNGPTRGVRFCSVAELSRDPALRAALLNRYYAVTDLGRK